jgi:gamma-glutamyltranspeptidase
MYHSGIGGGGFMIVRGADGSKEVIDFRETVPSQAHQDMYTGNLMGTLLSGLSSGVPGELRGLEYLHRRYGVMLSSLLTIVCIADLNARDYLGQTYVCRQYIWLETDSEV